MPIYTATFPKISENIIFSRGGHGPPLESPMAIDIIELHFSKGIS